VCYQDYVLGDGSAYNNAYFEVAYVKVFGTPGEDVVLEGSASRIASTLAWAGAAALAALSLW
jgi:hypothetical protein